VADNYTRQGQTFRAIDNSSVFLPIVGVVPGGLPIVVSGAQYAQTVTSSVFTQTVPSGATHCLISVRNDAVHYTEDGTTPSATNGIYLPAGFIGELAIPQALKFFRVTSDAIVAISYRRYA
jgi:hypothetical protein